MTDWFDKNKFKKILNIVDSNEFNHKNKIGEFKYNEIKHLVNNTENNTISEIDAKNDLKRLFKIKNTKLKKYKIHTSTQKKLLNLFDDLLKTILINNDNDNDNDNNDNDNNDNNDNENKNKNKNENKNNNMKKNINNWLDKIIDKTNSFEDQTKSLKKVKDLEPWFMSDCGDKELKFKIFKLKLADLSNIIDKKLFEQIFGHTFETLANKLINTTNKEENQIIVNDIKKIKINFTKKMKQTLLMIL